MTQSADARSIIQETDPGPAAPNRSPAGWTSSTRRGRIVLALAFLSSGLAGGIVFSHHLWGLDWTEPNRSAIGLWRLGTWPLAWGALVPFLVACLAARTRLGWVLGALAAGWLWNYGSLYWLNTLLPFNPFIPVGVALLAFVLGGAFVYIAAMARWLASRIHPLGWSPAIATLWTGLEFARTLGPFAFPWNFLGHSQALGNAWTCQVVSLAGVVGLSWIIVLVNAALAQAIVSRWPALVGPACPQLSEGSGRALAGGTALVVIWSCVLYPYLSLKSLEVASPTTSLDLAVIQPCIPQVEKMRFYMAPDAETAQRLDTAMTRKILAAIDTVCSESKPRLIVLPESAFNSTYFIYDVPLHKQLEERARVCGSDIVFGADRREPQELYLQRLAHPFSGSFERAFPALDVCTRDDGSTMPCEPGPMVTTVAAYFVRSESGLSRSVYDKIRLVPFGETAPLLDRIPYFQDWILMVGSFARGTEFTQFRTRDLAFSVMICFESAFADLARAFANRGAQFLCVITNDGWYERRHLLSGEVFWMAEAEGRSVAARLGRGWHTAWRNLLAHGPLVRHWLDVGPVQHLAQSVMRAIEVRRPIVRAANTGISCVITPDGRILEWLPWGSAGTIETRLTLRTPPPTLYARLGDWFGWACLAVTLVCGAVAVRAALRKNL